MSSNFLVCSITGKATTNPVVSLKTGKVYEKSTLAKHIDMYGTSPATNQKMTHNDYLELKGQNKIEETNPLEKKGVHELVEMLRDDYDGVSIEIYAMKKYIAKLRRELSHSLYQNDAACRVVARVLKERDEAREALSDLKAHTDKLQFLEDKSSAKKKKPYMPSSYILKIQEKMTELHTERKQNKKMKNAFIKYPSAETISSYETSIEAKISNSSITSIDFEPYKGEIMVISTSEKNISIFNKNFKKIEASFNTAYVPLTAFFVPKLDTDDNKKNILIANSNGGFNMMIYDTELHQFEEAFEVEIGENLKNVQLHPLGFLVLGLKGGDTWFVYDLRNKRMVYEGYSEGVVSLGVHVDGHIIALCGKDGKIRFVNLCEGEEILKQDIDIVKFSENGYHLFTASSIANKLEIWDLRGGNKQGLYKELEFDNLVDSIDFDRTGKHLMVSCQDVHIFTGKKYKPLASFKGEGTRKNVIRFGFQSEMILSGDDDGNFVTYSG